ncbi:MAG: hypothetical protein NTV52_02510 [Acidobacteria bacterium]|nr:hypothetical protein [Acidobacteriota bacterium]
MIQDEFQNQIERQKKILYKVCDAYYKDRDGREFWATIEAEWRG